MGRPQRSKRRKSLAERSAEKPLTEEQREEIALKMCGEKKRFEHRGDAQRLADEYGLGTYKCLVCGGWHFTSKT
ncbi:MAG: hypothetical protein QM648_00725 [Solirubrobacterales bacterium]